MKSKVTLREMVGTKIIYALLIAVYYWMWARQDWHEYYLTIQYAIVAFSVLFFAIQADRVRKYKKEQKDELAIQNLRRTDSICLRIMMAAVIIIAFAGGVTFIDGRIAGYALVGTIVVLTIIRFAAFCIMDSKGV